MDLTVINYQNNLTKEMEGFPSLIVSKSKLDAFLEDKEAQWRSDLMKLVACEIQGQIRQSNIL